MGPETWARTATDWFATIRPMARTSTGTSFSTARAARTATGRGAAAFCASPRGTRRRGRRRAAAAVRNVMGFPPGARAARPRAPRRGRSRRPRRPRELGEGDQVVEARAHVLGLGGLERGLRGQEVEDGADALLVPAAGHVGGGARGGEEIAGGLEAAPRR